MFQDHLIRATRMMSYFYDPIYRTYNEFEDSKGSQIPHHVSTELYSNRDPHAPWRLAHSSMRQRTHSLPRMLPHDNVQYYNEVWLGDSDVSLIQDHDPLGGY